MHAQNRQQENNVKRKCKLVLCAPDRVLLSTDNLRLAPSLPNKLTNHFTRVLTIKERVGPMTYKLDVNPEMTIHLVFHVSRL